MDVKDFFSYLFARQTSRQLAEQLLDVYRGRSRPLATIGPQPGTEASR